MAQKGPRSLKTIIKKPFDFFLSVTAFFLFFYVLTISSCAVVQAPTGGLKDTLPPRYLGSIPRNYTRNFTGQQILIIFDEYLKIKDQSTSVYVSPEPEKPAEIKVKQKSISITFKTPLEKNRTYAVNFGNSIIDYNEGNALHNFRFVFSTGPKIDSLKITGHVLDPLDTTSKKDVYVILHKAGNDSAIIKQKPLLFTTTDKDGDFEMDNIAPGDYSLYALEESNKNKKYDGKSESIAFLNKSIHLKKDTADVNLSLFKENPDQLKVLDKKMAGGFFRIVLNKPVDSIDFQLLMPDLKGKHLLVEKNAKGDTNYLWFPVHDLDSVRFQLLDKGKPALKFSQNNYVKNKKPGMLYMVDNLKNNLKSPAGPLTITTTEPLDTFLVTQLELKEDSDLVTPDSIVHNKKKVRSYEIYYAFDPARKYTLTIKPNQLTSIYGSKNPLYKRIFKAGTDRNYGTINLTITTPKPGSYVVQLLDDNFKLIETRRVTKTQTLVYRYLDPGKVRFRVVYDRNNNGRYDSGDLIKKLQPEPVFNSKQITTRSNFEQNLNFPIPNL